MKLNESNILDELEFAIESDIEHTESRIKFHNERLKALKKRKSMVNKHKEELIAVGEYNESSSVE